MMANNTTRQDLSKDEIRRKRRRIKKMKSLILSVLLLITVTCVCYGSALYLGIFNQNAVNNAINRSEYFYSIPKKAVEKAYEYGYAYGIPKEVFSGENGYDEVFSKSKAYNDGIAVINANIEGEEYVPDNAKIQKVLNSNISTYIENTGAKLDNAEIENLIDEIVTYYEEIIKIPYIEQYAEVRVTVNKVIATGVPLMIVLSVVLLVLQFRIHKTKVGALKYVAYSASGAVITSLIIPAVMLFIDILEKMGIYEEYLYNMVSALINSTFLACIIFGIGCLVAYAAIFIYIFNKQNNKAK